MVYKAYVYRVLKQVHPDLGASGKTMQALDMMMADMFERLATEASRLAQYAGRAMLTHPRRAERGPPRAPQQARQARHLLYMS